MNDDLDRFAALRPATPADDNWADSPEGRATLARIHRRAAAVEGPVELPRVRRRWVRPVLAVSAAVVVGGGATATGVILSRTPTNPAQVLCLRTASTTSDEVGLSLTDPNPAAALQACSSRWTELFPGDPTPAGYAVCVYPVTPVRNGTAGGAQVVIPAPSANTGSTAACIAAGFDPIDGS